MYKTWIWYGIIFIAVISLIFMGFGFYNAIQFSMGVSKAVPAIAGIDASSSMGAPVLNSADNTANVTSKINLNNKKNVTVLILGDSIARGVGDEKNKGIGGNLVELLKNVTPKEVIVENAGIDGLTIEGFVEQIKGGILDKGIVKADFLVVSIGGNDLREIRAANNSIEQESLFKSRQEAYVSGVKYAIQRVRELNKAVTIIFAGVYNPYESSGSTDINRYLSTWNNSTEILCDGDYRTVFVPVYSLFKYNIERYIAPDNLHPNAMGYYTIAFQIYKTIENYFTIKN